MMQLYALIQQSHQLQSNQGLFFSPLIPSRAKYQARHALIDLRTFCWLVGWEGYLDT